MQANDKNKPQREHPDLDRRYGEIGISAVAAALPYWSNGKNPANAPVEAQPQEDREEVVA